MHRRIFRTTALAAALAFSSVAFTAGAAAAQSTPSATAAAPHSQASTHSVLEELNLTEAQQSTIRETMQRNFQALRPQMQAVTQKREAFANVTPGTSGYQSTVNDLAQAEADLAKSETLRQGAFRAKVYNVLTPAQRTKLKSLLAEQRARVKKMREATRVQRAAGGSAPPASH
ncbi:MAG: Spy/CpxP family protein refolding chaperone [Rhodanobacteraceae bacterium]